ncbi:MAG: putative Lipoprotein [Deltaproteobacteria bacterium]|nr:putative Lipoprotein [Deltaproteobacteria bacterium]MBP2685837.1 putative Lipoprotein [Deltaproteobacteria bacterium]
MFRSRWLLVIAGALALLTVSTFAAAADPTSYRNREGRYEITLQPRYIASKTIDFGGGTSIDTDDDLGFGMGFGYNFTNKFALHADWSWASMNYNAKINTTDSAGNPTGTTTASGTLDSSTLALNLSYYFLDGPLTPFVLGGIGWTWVDSNIPSGLPTGGCWWDPWYGYICTTYQETYAKDYFSYSLGLGGRWDVSPGFFLRGSVVWQWMDTGKAGTTDFPGGRLDIGFLF